MKTGLESLEFWAKGEFFSGEDVVGFMEEYYHDDEIIASVYDKFKWNMDITHNKGLKYVKVLMVKEYLGA